MAAKKTIRKKPKARRSAAPQKRDRNGVVRDGNGRFKKGTAAANPGGRPKADHQITELARQHTELALRTLAEIAGDAEAPHSARVSASTALLDRGWGRPRQALEHSGPDGADLPAAIAVALVKPDEGDE